MHGGVGALTFRVRASYYKNPTFMLPEYLPPC